MALALLAKAKGKGKQSAETGASIDPRAQKQMDKLKDMMGKGGKAKEKAKAKESTPLLAIANTAEPSKKKPTKKRDSSPGPLPPFEDIFAEDPAPSGEDSKKTKKKKTQDPKDLQTTKKPRKSQDEDQEVAPTEAAKRLSAPKKKNPLDENMEPEQVQGKPKARSIAHGVCACIQQYTTNSFCNSLQFFDLE